MKRKPKDLRKRSKAIRARQTRNLPSSRRPRRSGASRKNTASALPAEVISVRERFGFVRLTEAESDLFVPGRDLMGAMPGDRVLVEMRVGRDGRGEGRVTEITEENKAPFAGRLIRDEYGRLAVLPDTLTTFPLIVGRKAPNARVGDKVVARIASRGDRHMSHRVEILESYGNADNAATACQVVVDLAGVPQQFSDEVLAEADRVAAAGIPEAEMARRIDLRDKPIFTIDGADTRDIDDAISIEREGEGWMLGVHIADVSHYVRHGSILDLDARERGTSIYYADKVIPMLPKALSNGICSLNPQEDRLAFSALMHLTPDGRLLSWKFCKTVIRSRVQGVYSEINRMLTEGATPELEEKYREVLPELPLMQELAGLLRARRMERGSLDLETFEPKFLLDEQGICIGISAKGGGLSEGFIEEFMLVANQAAASFAQAEKLPHVYRVHEDPPTEKLSQLKEILEAIGIDTASLREPVDPKALSAILRAARDTEQGTVVNFLILRSMAKAKYQPDNIGHFGLALRDYSQFTSPIRRYPDLMIHRIMSEAIAGARSGDLHERYDSFVEEASASSSEAELRAMNIERDCDDRYKAEYIAGHLGERYTGTVSGATNFGIYVSLENTVDGLIRIADLGEGFAFDGAISVVNTTTGVRYRIGDRVDVLVVAADISTGRVTFSLA